MYVSTPFTGYLSIEYLHCKLKAFIRQAIKLNINFCRISEIGQKLVSKCLTDIRQSYIIPIDQETLNSQGEPPMKATKEVTVLARYAHKNRETGELTGVVTYLVRSADGKSQYCTTIVNGKASACSCDGNERYHRNCKHMKAVECKEAGRPFASKQLPVWAMWLVESGVLVAPKHAIVMPAQEIDILDRHAELMRQGAYNLNGAQQSAGLLMELPSRQAIAS
jgi:hypothetical protein